MQATLALNTIQDLVSQVQKGLQGPGLYDLKAALLDSALKRIDGVAGIYEKSTSKEATTAAALMELGKIYRQLGQTQKAFQAYQKCLEITKERVKIKNYSDPSRQNLANTYFELAFCSEELNRDMKATLSYNQDGLKLYEDIYNKPKLDDFPLDRKIVRAGLAEAYTRVGVTQYRMGELTAALENYRKAYNLRRELADELKDNPRFKQDLSYSMMALAETNFRLGDRTLADDFYRQVLDQREAMAKLKPNDLMSLKELGDVYYMIGEFKLRCGDLAAARRNLENSRDRRKDLVDREPRNVVFRRDLGMTLVSAGQPRRPGEERRRKPGGCTRRRSRSAKNWRRSARPTTAARPSSCSRWPTLARPPGRWNSPIASPPDQTSTASSAYFLPLAMPRSRGPLPPIRPSRSRPPWSRPSTRFEPPSARASAIASTSRPSPTSNRSAIGTTSSSPRRDPSRLTIHKAVR